MKLFELQYFFKVCQCKSFSKASQELYISRQALIRSISNLENELNRQLFSRGPSGVMLTAFGEMFYQYALPVAIQLEALSNLPAEFDKMSSDHITIGIRGNLRSAYTIRTCIENFQKEHPQIHIEIINCEINEIESFVRDGRMDTGFTVLPPTLPEISGIELSSSEFSLLIHKSHPLAHSVQISPEMLLGEKLVMPAFSTHPYKMLCQYTAVCGFEPNVIFSTVDMGLIFQLADKENIIGVLLDRDAEKGAELYKDLVIYPLQPPLILKMGLVHKKNMKFTQSQKLFVNYLKSTFNNK